jgi:hypothetical protein
VQEIENRDSLIESGEISISPHLPPIQPLTASLEASEMMMRSQTLRRGKAAQPHSKRKIVDLLI